MNESLYRLVFSRRLGMRVAVAEHARSLQRASGAAALASAALALLAAVSPVSAQTAAAPARPPVVFASKLPPPAFQLPRAVTALFSDPAGRGATTVLSGRGSVVGWSLSGDGKTLEFDQGSAERVLLNWQNFDIAQGYTVRFLQDKDPAKYVSALNRVWGDNPSVIQGQLLADREVVLVNPNGVHFGGTARVRAGRFVASALSVSDSVHARGIRNVVDGSAAFTAAGTDHRPTDRNAAVTVEAGAEISTAAGGDVLLVAPRVVNQGSIATPDGQTVLAAGDKVYLMGSSDPRQRGLIVAVDAFTGADGKADDTLSTAENSRGTAALAAQLDGIRAERGTINLVGLTVRQLGQVNATTAVKGANGVVLLQAMATTTALAAEGSGQAPARGLTIEAGSRVRVGDSLGTVEFGAGSVTAVQPDASGATQLDAEVFNRSAIVAEAASISVGRGARILAPAGDIALKAVRSTTADPIFNSEAGGTGRADDSRIVVAPDAQVSTAGLRGVAVDGARNQGTQRLFRIELADAPVQRDGPLYRSAVFFDLRDAARIGAADLTGAAAALARTAVERSTAGGSISLRTNGALLVGDGAVLDVSGGSLQVGEAVIRNSLLAQGGNVVSFRALPAGTRVDALLPQTQDRTVPAYTEGADGGTLLLSGRQVVLAGAARGEVVVGDYQRDLRSPAPRPATLALGEGSGSSHYLAGIALRANHLPVLDAGLFADPFGTELSLLPSTADLSLAGVAAGGFGNLRLRALAITQPEFGRLDLGVRGSLDAAAATVALHGAFSAAGGRLAVSTEGAELAGGITVSGASRLDVAGRWTNDSAAGGGLPAPVQTDGGSVSLAAESVLSVAPGAVIDVSAGARLSGAGAVSTGKAGSVGLSVRLGNVGAVPAVAIAGAQLRGFDFATGGALALVAPSVTLAAAGDPAETAATAAAGGVTLAPDWFSAGGFGRIALTGGDVRVAAGTRLAPTLLNWQLADGFRSAASGAVAAAVATPQAVDPRIAEPRPVNLSLTAGRPLNESFRGGSLSVERGAAVELPAGSALALGATFGIDIGVRGGAAGGTSLLAAPGGAIALLLSGARGGTTAADPLGFVPTQSIWLGNSAQLAVDGVALLRPDTAAPARFAFAPSQAAATPIDQRVTGSVLGGGSITLAASRGSVMAEAGASLSLNGAAASLNLPGVASRVSVARAAGSLRVSSPEGIAIDARVSAQAPRNAAGQALADGGRLQMAIGAGGVEAAREGQAAYPEAPRVLAVGTADGEIARLGATWGSDLTASSGRAWLRASLLDGSATGSGFAGLQLGAGQAVRFESPLALALPLGLQLNAPAIQALPGVQVAIDTAYAQLGDAAATRREPLPDTAAVPDASPLRDTRLAVRAGNIDLVGNVGLQGFSAVDLDATQQPGGEIRLSAVAPNFDAPGSRFRQLAFAGTLRLAAGQIYATSGSQFTLAGSGDDSRLVIAGAAAGAPALPPLTAFGSLSASAADIVQGGVLRQPFGRIALDATRSLTLAAGSVTSVSGSGASVIYGQTVNLADWRLPGPVDLNSAGDAERKGITLRAGQIVTDPLASVSAAGGGSVLAWEFFKGVGGTRDHFADAGVYAVLPDYGTTAPLPVEGGAPALDDATRQIVVTLPGAGLAAGRYSLLPARYALLGASLPQGAFLVSRSSNQGSTTLRAPLALDDGSVVVTGYTSRAGALTEGTPGERFVVEPQRTFSARSDVRLTDISTLRLQRAASLGAPRPALPRDGGLLQVQAGADAAPWLAALNLKADGGQAGQLDVAAARVALVGGTAQAPAGSFSIGADVLAASGAGSVLLGGLRSLQDGGAWRIDAGSTQGVAVDLGGARLQAEELLLAAGGDVMLKPGTALAAPATGTLGARTLQIAGSGALLAVSANALQLERAGAGTAGGVLGVGTGSTLSAPQVLLDATGALALPPDLQLDARALALGAPRIVVGAAATAGGGAAAAVLTDGLLASARSASDLTLRAYDGIDFAGTQDWTQRVGTRLVLDAPLVRGVAAADGAAVRTDIAAQDIVLRNGSGREAGTADTGTGSLHLLATPPLRDGATGGLTLGPGAVALGFDSALLQSLGDVVLQGSGSTRAGKDMALSAARLTATTAADQQLRAAGTLSVQAAAGARTLGERVGQGAQVALTAQTLDIGGWVDLPGGALTLQAGGAAADAAAVTLRAASRLSTAGFALADQAGFTTAGAAGSIRIAAAQGRLELAGALDVSAAGEGSAGAVRLGAAGDGGALLLAPTARITGTAGSQPGDLGGRLDVDVARMADAGALAAVAVGGGMDRSFALRVRRGDLALDQPLRAARIAVAADEGRLAIGTVAGALLDARAPEGGVVQLAAGGDLVLGAGAAIDARASGTAAAATAGTAAGGDVLLASNNGRVRLDPLARVQAHAADAAGGRIVLRARRGGDGGEGGVQGRLVAVDPLTAARLQAADVAVEAVQVYTGVSALTDGTDSTDGSGTRVSQQRIRADNDSFMGQRAAVLAALGLQGAGAARVDLRAGVELRSDGDLTVTDNWDLASAPGGAPADRPGGSPGFLTLRAAGNLHLAASVSDGFTSQAGGTLNDNARSWSYRLVAGADLGAANPLAVRSLQDVASGADLTIGRQSGQNGQNGNVLLRTGAGSIALAAARDIVFAAGGDGAPASVYSAGRRIDGLAQLQSQLFGGFAVQPQFTTDGGRVELAAGRDIVSAEATQLVGNWLWRSAAVDAGSGRYTPTGQLAWWTQFDRFAQTVGAFGGGGITASAGRDIVNLQAMAPSAGWGDSAQAASARVHTTGGGGVDVNAGRDIRGGQFLLGRGQGRLDAGAAVAAAADNVNLAAPVLGLGDGHWQVTARGGVTLGAVLHPTAAPASRLDSRNGPSGYFFTWGSDAGIGIVANSGAVQLPEGLSDSTAQALGVDDQGLPALAVLPPTLAVTAAAGDIAGRADGVLFPSARGRLRLWAGGSIAFDSGARLAMSDTDPALWPGPQRPAGPPPGAFVGSASALLPNTLDDTLALAGLHAGDAEPVRIHADGTLAIRGATGAGPTLSLPKPATLTAGADIVELSLRTQHFGADDLSLVSAGRNMLAGENGRIEVVGPGALEVDAGRGVDLGASVGITTSGNFRNAALPQRGASVRVTAATAGLLNMDVLLSRWLAAPAQGGGSERFERYRTLLLQTVRDALQAPALGYDAALAAFSGFSADAQAAFGRRLLALEFRAVYLDGPAPTASALTAQLQAAFDARKAALLQAGQDALAAGGSLTLPGRETLRADALRDYLAALQGLRFDALDLGDTAGARAAGLAAIRQGWRDAVAHDLGSTAPALDALAAASPLDALAQAWTAALGDTGSRRFDSYRNSVVAREVAAAGTAASNFGRLSLPMRIALFDQGFAAAELGGIGSFVAQPIWPAMTVAPLLAFNGALDLTQSGIVTQRGGDIALVNPGGAINVGLKDAALASTAPKGVIALGGGDVFGYARDAFQVNTQRVFIVGSGDMHIWSSAGDIDSGRGANTAVAAPPLAARRTVDGVAFEVPATTTGSGLAILEDARGKRSGTIGLYPAFGEILALDAFIRAPALVLSAPVKGADNLVSASISGTGAPVSAPPPALSAPASTAAEARTAESAAARTGADARSRNALLTVELLGLGPVPASEDARCQDGGKAGSGSETRSCKDAEPPRGRQTP